MWYNIFANNRTKGVGSSKSSLAEKTSDGKIIIIPYIVGLVMLIYMVCMAIIPHKGKRTELHRRDVSVDHKN